MRLINRQPTRSSSLMLASLPFVLVIVTYLVASHLRLEANPGDKLLPAPQSFVAAMEQMAVEADARTGRRLLWHDTWASLRRLLLGLGISSVIGMVFGVAIGTIPYLRASLAPFVTVISMVPPLAILPVLFIVLGLGELSKVVLIVIGVAPFLMRDLALHVGSLPTEQIVKAQTLGASSWQIVLRVVLPQSLPRLLDALRLSLGPAWLFLIAAEAIAATDGLGYRIFLVRRYLAMDIILLYVAWITLLAFLLDLLLRIGARRLFPWSRAR